MLIVFQRNDHFASTLSHISLFNQTFIQLLLQACSPLRVGRIGVNGSLQDERHADGKIAPGNLLSTHLAFNCFDAAVAGIEKQSVISPT